ncbi:MAG: alpha/beta hydrolase [Saprospiraceae bacterium]|nr:alpha/beta hydrolase [Saprospiraceae bacterium]
MKTSKIIQKNVQVDDFTANFNEIGSGSKTILFLHGFPFDKSSWDKQLNFLEKKGYKTFALDIRGFGNSTSGTKTFSIDRFADDLIQFMDLKGIKKAVVCGLSMGGYILLNVVSRYPDRLNGIILCDTQCLADSQEAKQKRMDTIQKLTENGAGEFADGFIQKVFFQKALEQKKDLVIKTKSIILKTSIASLKSGLEAIAGRNNTCSVLSEITMPALIICGKEDVITPPALSKEMHKNIKNSTLCLIENAGHLSNLERPIAFNNALFKFLHSVYS